MDFEKLFDALENLTKQYFEQGIVENFYKTQKMATTFYLIYD